MTVEKFECQERKEARIAALDEKLKVLAQTVEYLKEKGEEIPLKIKEQIERFEKERASLKS